MNLIYTVNQFKNGMGPNKLESAFCIEVEYDPQERVVEEIISVYTYKYFGAIKTDVTAIFSETFPKELERMLEAADWWQIYCDAKEENRQKVA